MTSVFLRLLGGIEVLSDGRAVEVGHTRQRCVLAALLVDAGRPVTADRLIDRVWADHPHRRANVAFYSYLSRLRRAPAHAPDADIRRNARPETVDLHHFRALVSRARDTADDERAMNEQGGSRPPGASCARGSAHLDTGHGLRRGAPRVEQSGPCPEGGGTGQARASLDRVT
ncbi:hypothetical protein [Streptomyces sp. NPDC126503]|uniref:AfsR/SARP family transcriptional regulator n=1 Tax=Streptomyces sp. NPDC126503 TaxID=3155315 RepID=UPI003319817A